MAAVAVWGLSGSLPVIAEDRHNGGEAFVRVSGLIEHLIFDYPGRHESEIRLVPDGSPPGVMLPEGEGGLMLDFSAKRLASEAFTQPVSGQRATVDCVMEDKLCRVVNFEAEKLADDPVVGRSSALWFVVDVRGSQNRYDEKYVAKKMELNSMWYRKSSYGQMDFPVDSNDDGKPDVLRVYLNDVTGPGGCNYRQVATSAKKIAEQRGYDVKRYEHLVFVLPKLGCRWGGLANTGCYGRIQCRAWIASPDWDMVYPHEIGHNIGMHHASAGSQEYGDGSCPMGNRLKIGFFNGPHTVQMGWLDEKRGHSKTITRAGRYQINALSSGRRDGEAQVVRFNLGSTKYFMTYRPGTSFDRVDGEFKKGVNIYSHPGGLSKTRYYLTLAVGRSAGNSQIQLRTISKDRNKAIVDVSFRRAFADEGSSDGSDPLTLLEED